MKTIRCQVLNTFLDIDIPVELFQHHADTVGNGMVLFEGHPPSVIVSEDGIGFMCIYQKDQDFLPEVFRYATYACLEENHPIYQFGNEPSIFVSFEYVKGLMDNLVELLDAVIDPISQLDLLQNITNPPTDPKVLN